MFEGGARELSQDACFGNFSLFCKLVLKLLQRSLVLSLATKKNIQNRLALSKNIFWKGAFKKKQTKRQLMVRRCQAKTNGEPWRAGMFDFTFTFSWVRGDAPKKKPLS